MKNIRLVFQKKKNQTKTETKHSNKKSVFVSHSRKHCRMMKIFNTLKDHDF